MNAAALTLAVFNLSVGEIILILALMLVLVGARRLPEIGQGLRLGFRAFRKASRDVTDEMDGAAHDAGESLGGIYGKPAGEALTPDNKVAELYDPAAFRGKARSEPRGNFWLRLWRRFRALFFPRAAG